MSSLTPVQRLNREGVEAVRRHQLEKAQSLFYKAYLYDPSDPFTLNNLGYSAELSGDADRARMFYALAEKQDCDAVISLSSLNELQGKTMPFALENLQDAPLRLNRLNVEAIELLEHDRSFEAAVVLRRALELDPRNPFTLNNLGVAEEAEGDLEQAIIHYGAAAATQSDAKIVISPAHSWRGKPIQALAQDSLDRVHKRLEREGVDPSRATMLTIRAVREANENNWPAAEQDFKQAYALNPTSSFSLNNIGYIEERQGDLETADYYYARARMADDAKARIGLSTDASAQGKHLLAVESDTGQAIDAKIAAYSEQRKSESAAPTLIPRGGGAVPEPPAKPETQPPAQPPATPPAPAPQPQP